MSESTNSSSAAAVAAALNDGKIHLLLAASGSVATIKLPLIVSALSASFGPSLSIRIILTESATHFLAGQSAEQPTVSSLASIPAVAGVHLDEHEWAQPGWTRGSSILHIELRRWADLLVVAPLSANMLAKVTTGICDDLLSSVIRAWDVKGKGPGSIMVAPAMNTMMWEHPLTERQLRVLREDWEWFGVLVPYSKGLACGDVGQGAMMEWSEIVTVIEKRLRLATQTAEEIE